MDAQPDMYLYVGLSVGFVQTKTCQLLVFHRKDLCEARVKPKMNSNFQKTFPDIPPRIEFKFSDDVPR